MIQSEYGVKICGIRPIFSWDKIIDRRENTRQCVVRISREGVADRSVIFCVDAVLFYLGMNRCVIYLQETRCFGFVSARFS
ncbi:hypothetical protein Desti_2238 [Desulfomonile tiedjei DSM 6799]|uniref:Uncharacterized protein n=1 Tax=Desulfomonile tiedjei (strain ATCC 49306 / DSM 6799 / DCB-1) TaxID=706587 RepID=I4C5T8_DESTA|nr:hypothetical protein Desti_2238 [Desulfomonile tiedjei DSM 6799]